MNEDQLKNLIREFINVLGFEHTIELSQDADKNKYNIFIGDLDRWTNNKPEVLAAFNHLIYLVIRKRMGEAPSFIIDVNNWREFREKEIKEMVLEKAKEARFFKKVVALPSMSAYERRTAHLALAGEVDLTTESEGNEPERYVIIKPVIKV
ncbi:MAG: hypothetical protein HYV52_02060 [Parcubacteria group bacterium]|nr:hypothetical protein [Parcubacteria group bacterium]